MERKPGTVELLIQDANFFLQPLFAALEDDGLQAFLEIELDVDLPEGTFQGAALSGDINQCKSAVVSLFSLIGELKSAFSENDISTIAAKAAEAIDQIKNIAESVKQLRDHARQISGSLPEPLSSQLEDYCGQLFERTAMLLTIIYTDSFLIRLETLHLIGILEVEPVTFGGPQSPKTIQQEKIHFNRLTDLIQSPVEHLKSVYRWGEDDFRAEAFLERLSSWLLKENIQATFKPATAGQPASVDSDFFRIDHHKKGTVQGLSVLHKIPIPDNLTIAYNLSELWNLELKVTGGFKEDFSWLISAPGDFSVLSTNEVNAGIALNIFGLPVPPDEKLSLLSLTDIGRLDASKINCLFQFNYSAGSSLADSTLDFIFETSIIGGELEVAFGQDGFLSFIAQAASYKASFDLSFRYSIKDGLQVKGSGGPEIQLPMHIGVGPVSIIGLTIALRPASGSIPLDVGATIRGELGPLTILIERIGLKSTFSFPGTDGNLGPLNLDIGFRAPEGVGLSIDAGGFKGGGFLDFEPEQERYSGMLELEYQNRFSLKAIGLLNTRLPNGQSGFSLLIIITSEFTPIQLGFGFKLNGVGGLLGLNRTVKTERLVSGLRDNTLSSILFPTNIIANAERIISDLRQVFPPQSGRFVFGPMAKITWGTPTLITVDLGLIIEIPDPVRIVILGVVRGIVPDEETAILRIQVNFLGVIDFEKEQFSFDASLFDSKLLGFTLTGDMAVRLYWGANANFLQTVGGFHPAYQPPPMNLPALRRLTLALLSGDNPRLTLEYYFAVTSNTVQFGSRLELYAAAWKFNAYGFLSYDVLFQFNPFYFVAEITAMLALRVGTSSIASIKLALTLEGPTPWKAKGEASLKICWFLTVKIRFNKTFGEARNTTLPDLAVLPLLLEALSAKDNWEEELSNRRHRLESLREVEALDPDQIFVHPVGILRISQKVAPLNLRIDRLGSQRPSDSREFRISEAQLGTSTSSPEPAEESFAPAQFFDMDDEEKLASPSFKNFDSGIKLGEPDRLHTAYAAAREVKYELKYIDSQRDQRLARPGGLFDIDPLAFNTWTLQGAIAKSDLSFARRRKSFLAPEEVTVVQEPFAIVSTSDLKLFDDASLMSSERAALTRISVLIESNPALRGKLQAVPAFEAT